MSESVVVCMCSHQSQAAWTFFPPVETRAFKLQRQKSQWSKPCSKINSFSSRLCPLGGHGSTSAWQPTKSKTFQECCKTASERTAGVQHWRMAWKTHHQDWFRAHDQYLWLWLYEAGPVSWPRAVLRTPLVWKMAQTTAPEHNEPDMVLSVSFH